MRTCKVASNSKRGEQLITMYGDTWHISDAGWVPMQCFNNNLGMRLTSLDGEHTRNVRMILDKNLNIYYIKEEEYMYGDTWNVECQSLSYCAECARLRSET